MHELSSRIASIGAQVDDVVGALDDVQVMLNHHHGMSLGYQGVERIQEFADVVDVKPGGGFVKHEQSVALAAPTGKERSQFDALRFAAAQGV